jgi:hypothetical protein
MTLVIEDFKRYGEPDSFQHYYAHRLKDGRELCLEACIQGYCVAIYNKHAEIIGDKTCTDLPDIPFGQEIATGLALRSDKAITKALQIANTITSI